MRKYVIFFTLFFTSFCFKVHSQTGFEKITDELQLMLDNYETITNIQTLDERYIYFVMYDKGFLFSDGYEGGYCPFVYDLEKNKLIDFTKDLETDKRFKCGTSYETKEYNLEPHPYFTYNNSKIYYVDTRSNTQLIVYDLDTESRVFHNIDSIGSNYIVSGVYDNEIYLAISGDNLQVLKVNGDSISTVLKTPTYHNRYFRPFFLRAVPVFHNQQLFINEINQIRAYNLETNTLDTLMNVDSVIFYYHEYGISVSSSMITQTKIYNDELYVVYKIANFGEGRYEYLYGSYSDSSSIWKTNGTKEGTKEIKIHESDDAKKLNMSTKLIQFQDGLFWVGLNYEEQYYEIFKINEVSLESLGKLLNYENIGKEYTESYLDNRRPNTSIYDQIETISSVDGIQRVYWRIDLQTNYIWTVDDDSVKNIYYKELNFDPIAKLSEIHFFPVNSDTILMFETYYKDMDGTGEDKQIVSLIDITNQNIYKIDSVNLLLWEFGKNGFQDGKLFFSTTDYNENGRVFSLWKYSLNGNPTFVKSRQDVSRNIFSVYPNPATNTVTIQSSESLNGQLMIVGVDGKIHQTLRVNGHQNQIDVSRLTNGMYVAIYQDNSSLGTQSFIIQR